MSTTYTALANAIMREENSQLPNNPGALFDTNGNPLSFSTAQQGFQALLDKLTYDISGQSKVYDPNMSITQFEGVYTGGDPNAGNNVASILGVSPSTPVSQLSDQALASKQGGFIQDAIDSAKQTLGNVFGTNPSDPASWGGTKPPSATGASTSAFSAIGADVAAVLVGLVLIAGAVFTFDAVKTTVINTAKKGAALAAV